jgi:hypothetical protein
MRLSRLLLLLALGTVPAAGAAQRPARVATPGAPAAGIPARREFRHRETILVEYHEASGYGAVELRPALVAESPEVRVQALFTFPGRRPAAPPAQVSFAVVSTAPSARFTDAPRLSLLLDGARPIRAATVVKQVGHVPDGVRETVAARLPRATFLRLATAERATVVVDSIEIPLGETSLEALRDLASRMSPAGFEAALAAHEVTEHVEGFTRHKVLYEAGDVDSVARPTLLARAKFPAGVPRTMRYVRVEFVVDTLGRVEVETLRGQSPTADAPFLAELRAVAPLWEFAPARVGGRAVRQIVRQEVVFDPLDR